jgi:CBS domain-containing protein
VLVYDCMSRSPVTVSPKESLADARRRMTEHEVHQLPVVDAGRYLGLLTERDLSVHETHRADRTVAHAYRPFVDVLAPEIPDSPRDPLRRAPRRRRRPLGRRPLPQRPDRPPRPRQLQLLTVRPVTAPFRGATSRGRWLRASPFGPQAYGTVGISALRRRVSPSRVRSKPDEVGERIRILAPLTETLVSSVPPSVHGDGVVQGSQDSRVARRRSRERGLVRKSSMPAARQRSRSPLIA